MPNTTSISSAIRVLAASAACTLVSAAALANPPPKQPPPLQAGTIDASGVYQLSAEEQAMDCKRLTGRMQVRILQVRETRNINNTSDVSNQMKETAAPVVGLLFGKSQAANDPAKRQSADLAMLTAYNKQLAAKGCKTYDLQAELNRAPGGKDLPRPVPPPGAQPAAKAPAH